MSMEIIGTVSHILPQVTGTSQSGNQWVKQEFVIQTIDDRYPKSIAFNLFGADRIQQANLQGGQLVKVRFEPESHEYNGRWYTQLTAWSVAPYQVTLVAQETAPAQQPMQQVAPQPYRQPAQQPFPPRQPQNPQFSQQPTQQPTQQPSRQQLTQQFDAFYPQASSPQGQQGDLPF